jgi:hypothetical protein
MMQALDPACLDAFIRLLARPDPVDLPRRGHVCRFDGDPDRRATRLPRILTAWLQRRYLEIDAEDAVGAARPSGRPHSRRPELETTRRGPSLLTLVPRRSEVCPPESAVARCGGSR